MSAAKREDPDFLAIISQYDLTIFLESWTCKASKLELSVYDCHNFYRKYRHRQAKHNSGGVVIYTRNSISSGISVVKNIHDTIIWLNLDHF